MATDDAVSVAYDQSEYGEKLINRIEPIKWNEDPKIDSKNLKQKLVAILEENEETDEVEGNSGNVYKPKSEGITEAQLAAYQQLLSKIDKDGKDYDKNTNDETSTILYSLASTKSQSRTLYSLRKVKDYLQKKAKEAKRGEIEQQRIKEQEITTKIIEEDRKGKNKLTSLFNPMLKVDNEIISNPENEEAKENFEK